MTDLIPTINKTIKYGLQPNFSLADREKLLQKHLVKIYSLYFDINCTFDETEYSEINEVDYSDIRKNVTSNFPELGFYKTIPNINDLYNFTDYATGDALDDLSDIILHLLEVKWRIENNSLANGLWYFELIFRGHTQQHILDLLNYLKQKKG
ncbi:hypothetical protein [Chryseobacterium sp. Leaf394]|uniref:hypothetical protein n=1 Tax=Chryseobacterium sp. Leaf394 TaxID=1736361 RepID=UPI0006F9FE23|nr:hypothetical protein [Chryseobacterium sp. Leaf394]KQS92773.1 hypothetical protein ASG21_10135 [Chryseobacterium sp. Leaf394]